MYDLIFFYKRFISIGGAERLMIEEYRSAVRQGIKPIIITLELSKSVSQVFDISDVNFYIPKSSGFLRYLNLGIFFYKNKKSKFLCASGWLELYFYHKILNLDYSLHLHHPCFMSFNDTDKYSLFQKKNFTDLVNSNIGATRFLSLRNNLTLLQVLIYTLKERISRLAIKSATFVFVLSEYAKLEKKKVYGINAIVERGAVDQGRLNDLEYIRRIRKSTINCPPKKLITVARLDENKRLDELIMGCKAYLNAIPGSQLNIVGGGPLQQNLQAMVEDLGLSEKVFLLGRLSDRDLSDLYHESDLFVSLDWADFRITSYEALQHGCPVLLSSETDRESLLEATGWIDYIEPQSIMLEKYLYSKIILPSPSLELEPLEAYLKEVSWDSFFGRIASRIFSTC
jgi:glycosyltransferase involved in cell wall biosynthesis